MARLSLHLSNCQIVGNLMPRLNYMTMFAVVQELVLKVCSNSERGLI